MENQTVIERPSTDTLLRFIVEYRRFESASYEAGYEMLRRAFFATSYSKKDFDHICDKWHHNKKDFAGFFLGSLSYPKMITLLNYWGIPVDGGKEFIDKCSADHTYGFLNEPPTSARQFYKLVLFFNNHGISREPIEGFILERPASSKHRFGNSANWGRYILTLQDPDKFFDDLYQLYKLYKG